MANESYQRGNHWVIDDISGQKVRVKDVQRDWRGLYMTSDNWSPKEKQLTIRPRQEKIAVSVVRTQDIDETLADAPFNAATDAI